MSFGKSDARGMPPPEPLIGRLRQHDMNETAVSPGNLLLTIMVPTYNRRKLLEGLLRILLPVLQESPDVEILISNNCSTDDTAAYLATLSGHSRLRVVNHEQPRQVEWWYKQPRGRFYWVFCDDDMATPEGIAFVCQTLREHPELGWIHLPHQYLSNTGQPVLSRLPAQDEWFVHGRQAFAQYISWITFLTSNIIRTELAQPQVSRVPEGTDFWPMGLLMAAVAEAPAFVPARRFITAGADITWAERRTRVLHCDLAEEILKSCVLSRAEKAACLRQKYLDTPNQLGRLLVIRPSLLGRVLWCQSRLLGILFRPSELAKVFRPSVWSKFWQRIVRGRKSVAGMFPKG